MRKDLTEALAVATESRDGGLAHAALVIATLEYPRLDPGPYLARLDEMGQAARRLIESRVDPESPDAILDAIQALNHYLFEDLGFAGNSASYDDPRDSCLNQVLERRVGIPITISVVYMEVAARAGVAIDGVNFPAHFLVRSQPTGEHTGVIIDPYHRGNVLTELHCRLLLQQFAGADVTFDTGMLAPASTVQIVRRMLLNLKRLYVHMRSFPQARDVSELLVEVTPAPLAELRDRGLLAYHLNDVTSALRDLQTYLKLSSLREIDEEEHEEHEQIWEHVKTLRRRVAGLN